MIIIEREVRQKGCVFYILFCLVLGSINEKKVRNQSLQNLLLFTIYRLANVTLGYIGKRSVFYNVVKSLIFSAIRGTEHIPTLVFIWHISYRHPCLWAMGFGEGIRSNPNTWRFSLASSCFHIRQCAHIGPSLRCFGSMLDTKKRGIAVVHSTYRGSSITYCCWTDNFRAHADMNIVPQSLTDRHTLCSLSAKGMRINTSRGRLRCYVQDNNYIVDLLDFRYVREQSVVNAFLCYDSLFHPMPALSGLNPSQLGVGCQLILGR